MRVSALVANVTELLRDPTHRHELRFSSAVPDLETPLARVDPGQALDFDLRLEWIEGGILVQGSISGESVVTCRRCLAESRGRLSVDVAEVYRPKGDEWEEGYVIDNETIDLGPLARDAILTAMPTNPLCRPDCAGLCPRCGKNLNEGTCECPEEVADARWSALKDLLEGS